MFHRNKTLRVSLLAAVALSVFTYRAQAAETVIDQKALKFVPDTVTINAGDTIRFSNSDRFFHDVTITGPDGASTDKGLINFKQEVVVPFAKAGTYKVTCRLHPAMTVAVTVK